MQHMYYNILACYKFNVQAAGADSSEGLVQTHSICLRMLNGRDGYLQLWPSNCQHAFNSTGSNFIIGA